jgi:hypothetical protein
MITQRSHIAVQTVVVPRLCMMEKWSMHLKMTGLTIANLHIRRLTCFGNNERNAINAQLEKRRIEPVPIMRYCWMEEMRIIRGRTGEIMHGDQLNDPQSILNSNMAANISAMGLVKNF